jgi:hypothetical protein
LEQGGERELTERDSDLVHEGRKAVFFKPSDELFEPLSEDLPVVDSSLLLLLDDLF